ncbi:MAG: hypothetical protein ACLQM8_15760 [Limisphaerales bacterium]
MKRRTNPQWMLATVCGLALACSMAVSQAQTMVNPQTFDAALGSWITWNGWGLQSPDTNGNSWLYWDGTRDASNNAASGSLRAEVPYTGNSGDQLMLFGTFGNRWGWDNGLVTNIVGNFDSMSLNLLVDPSSPPTKNGDYGNFTMGLITSAWGQISLTNISLPLSVAGNWTHFVVPIDQTLNGLDKITGAYFYMWSGGIFTNTFSFNADDIWLEPTPKSAPPIPPPTLTLTPLVVTPGLNFQTASTDGEWDRQNIATVSPNYSWVGASGPVTYSLTIAKYPGTNYPNFQASIYLASGANGAPSSSTDNAPDWDEPNCFFLQIQNYADGTASASLMWKTNDPGANAVYWTTTGTLGTVTEPAGPLGTWSITFVDDTNITLASPSGLTNQVFFPDDSALKTYFPQGSVVAYFGMVPNSIPNVGQGAVFSEVKITGPAATLTPIDDHFTEAALDPAVWAIAAAEPVDISLVHNDVHWGLKWSLPAVHYTLQAASSPLGPWTDVSVVTNAVKLGAVDSLLLPDAALSSKASTFFRMLKLVATQLQVLMPGETAAPGTSTGKTGTPDSQSISNPSGASVTVNAVDNNWNLVSYCSDTVSITSSDGFATLPNNAPLVNGTGTFVIDFGMTGPQTVTASDVSNTNVVSNTGSSTTVTP